MSALLSGKGSIVSRNTLMQSLWDDDCFVDENTLSVNMNRLRKKLESAGLPDYIVTKKGQGYIIE
jgi:DNA-binding response OmpR family regulator